MSDEEAKLRQDLQTIIDKLQANNTTNDTPSAEKQRQRRPGARRRRPHRRRPYFEDVDQIDFPPGNNRRVSNFDGGPPYRGPGVNKIPGRIQGLPFDNIGAIEDELTIGDKFEERYVPSATFGSAFRRPQPPRRRPSGVDCDFYTENLCLEVSQYPRDEIVQLLNHNRRVGADLVADVLDQSADNLVDGVTAAQENRYTFSHYYGNRREDGNHLHRDFAQDGGFLCPSEIKYAKPKRGKTAQGVWKDIVNVNDYTQTLRMEKCLKPGGTCSYVSHHYKSQCSQVYNYHRLLSWDKTRGLHMDIYKVPTCCSCHIMGYSYVYPPLKSSASARAEVPALPTSPPARTPPPPPPPRKSLLPELNINPQKEFQSFFSNLGNPFKRGDPIGGDQSVRPSKKQNSVVSRPRPQPPLRRPPPPRRRIEEGKRRTYIERVMDQTFMGSDNVETVVAKLDEDEAAHKYESIPIEAKSNDEEKDQQEPISSRTSKPVNYGYHPIIDFFDRYRFDAAA